MNESRGVVERKESKINCAGRQRYFREKRRQRWKKMLRVRVEGWSAETIQITQFDRCVYLGLNCRFSG